MKETRNTQRAVNSEGRKISGMAIIYNSITNLGSFFEKIEPGAAAACLSNDVRCLFNHDSNLLLGRTKSGTLRLQDTQQGLMYECDVDPNQTYASDLLISLRRNDVTGSSFAFYVGRDGQRWEKMADGTPLRVITKISRLYDVSPVTYPAYEDTTAAMRSLEQWLKGAGSKTLDEVERELKAIGERLKKQPRKITIEEAERNLKEMEKHLNEDFVKNNIKF